MCAPLFHRTLEVLEPAFLIRRLSLWRRADLQTDTFGPLQFAKDVEQVLRPRVPLRPAHPDQALTRDVGPRTQLLKSDRGVDVITQEDAPRTEIAPDVTRQGFREERMTEFHIVRSAFADDGTEICGGFHNGVLSFATAFVVCT